MDRIEPCLALYRANRNEIEYFRESVEAWLKKCSSTHATGFRDVYAVNGRLKDEGNLKDKLLRKEDIDSSNFFKRVTDLAGVRVLHLWPSQFLAIDTHIRERIGKDWEFFELPKAYTWDPETKNHFESLNITAQMKESYYTSVHYVVRPKNPDAFVTCEIQVRTLLEEVWGEIDHSINYPKKTETQACTDQLLVLAKLIATGSKLVSSIEGAHARGS